MDRNGSGFDRGHRDRMGSARQCHSIVEDRRATGLDRSFQAREGSRIKWVVEFGDAELAVPDDWRFDDYGDADKFVAALRSTWGH